MEEKILIKGKKGFPTTYILMNLGLIIFLLLGYINPISLELAFVFLVLALFAFVSFVVCIILTFFQSITVTNKKVIGGTTNYLKAIIPLETIETVNLIGNFGLSIKTTNSQLYTFSGYKNSVEIVETIKKLLPKKESTSNLEDLKKYKDLLDSGIITTEEFETKKKQILESH